MANVYVRSGAGGAGTGADWANAFTTLAAAYTAKAAGDDFWVSEDHSEQGAAVTLLCPGTPASPCRTICVDHAGSVPPVSADLRTTAVIGTTGAAALTWTASATVQVCYYYGIIWKTGSAGNAATQNIGLTKATFESCAFQLNTTNATSAFALGGGGSGFNCFTDFINCTWTFGAATQGFIPKGGILRFKGGSVAAAGTLPTTMYFTVTGTASFSNFYMDGVDLSALSNKTLVGAMNNACYTQFVNCKLPATVTISATPTNTQVTDLIISDSGSGNTRHERYVYAGPLTTETTIVRSGGASDGTTPISWKIVTNANAKPLVAVESFQIAVWNTTTGSSKTATVEIVNDGTTLTNADIWLEVEYLGSGSFPVSTLITNAPADPLAAATSLSTSSVTWTTTGLGSPVKQYLQVTFTPNLAGLVRAVVKIAKASKTVYIDPVITVA